MTRKKAKTLISLSNLNGRFPQKSLSIIEIYSMVQETPICKILLASY